MKSHRDVVTLPPSIPVLACTVIILYFYLIGNTDHTRISDIFSLGNGKVTQVVMPSGRIFKKRAQANAKANATKNGIGRIAETCRTDDGRYDVGAKVSPF